MQCSLLHYLVIKEHKNCFVLFYVEKCSSPVFVWKDTQPTVNTMESLSCPLALFFLLLLQNIPLIRHLNRAFDPTPDQVFSA